ncbi:hypothetical protein ACFVUY_07045 [Kitasatospora sp. NPDC058063]|uniref:hypothetical protein n=1 Tax=unclassified Kitasatospora TaxID=2633591 RepID=UPI0036DAB5D6
MNALRLLAVPAAALALTLSAATVAPAAPAASVPAAAPDPAPATVTISGADGGSTVQAHVGDTVQVEILVARDYPVTWYWYALGTSTPALLSQTAGSAEANGDSRGTFSVTAAGTGAITAIGRCVPDRGSICPPWVINWKVTVQIS